MIMLGKSLRLDVVAEGVETPEQLAFLREQSCSAFQGHITAPALDAEAFERFVRGMQTATPVVSKPATDGRSVATH